MKVSLPEVKEEIHGRPLHDASDHKGMTVSDEDDLEMREIEVICLICRVEEAASVGRGARDQENGGKMNPRLSSSRACVVNCSA